MLTMTRQRCVCSFFFFNDTATTEIYTLSLHDALPICLRSRLDLNSELPGIFHAFSRSGLVNRPRSEEHTSELQSQSNLVCRLLLEKKKKESIEHEIEEIVRLHTGRLSHPPRWTDDTC